MAQIGSRPVADLLRDVDHSTVQGDVNLIIHGITIDWLLPTITEHPIEVGGSTYNTLQDETGDPPNKALLL